MEAETIVASIYSACRRYWVPRAKSIAAHSIRIERGPLYVDGYHAIAIQQRTLPDTGRWLFQCTHSISFSLPLFSHFFLLRILFRGIGRWSSEIVSARSALVPAATLSAWPYKDLSFEKKKKRGRDSNLGWLGKHSEEKRERYVDPPAVRFHSLFPFSLLFTSIYIFSLLLVFFFFSFFSCSI